MNKIFFSALIASALIALVSSACTGTTLTDCQKEMAATGKYCCFTYTSQSAGTCKEDAADTTSCGAKSTAAGGEDITACASRQTRADCVAKVDKAANSYCCWNAADEECESSATNNVVGNIDCKKSASYLVSAGLVILALLF